MGDQILRSDGQKANRADLTRSDGFWVTGGFKTEEVCTANACPSPPPGFFSSTGASFLLSLSLYAL